MAMQGKCQQPARLITPENGQRSPLTPLQPKQSKVKSCETVVVPDPVLVEQRAMQTGFLWSLFQGQSRLLIPDILWFICDLLIRIMTHNALDTQGSAMQGLLTTLQVPSQSWGCPSNAPCIVIHVVPQVCLRPQICLMLLPNFFLTRPSKTFSTKHGENSSGSVLQKARGTWLASST